MARVIIQAQTSGKAGNLKGVPKFPPNKQVEVIFLIMDKPGQEKCTRRSPHRDIAGIDEFVSAVPLGINVAQERREQSLRCAFSALFVKTKEKKMTENPLTGSDQSI